MTGPSHSYILLEAIFAQGNIIAAIVLSYREEAVAAAVITIVVIDFGFEVNFDESSYVHMVTKYLINIIYIDWLNTTKMDMNIIFKYATLVIQKSP